MDELSKSPKTFTLSEAQAALPEVRSLVEQMQGIQRSIATTNAELEDKQAKAAAGNGYPVQSLKQQIRELGKHQLKRVEAFQSALSRLEELGCVLKDVNTGLVDFYSMREGELVFLCWKPGEERIRFWHTLEDGYPGRKPL